MGSKIRPSRTSMGPFFSKTWYFDGSIFQNFLKFAPKWRKFGTLIGQLFKIFRNLRQNGANFSEKFWFLVHGFFRSLSPKDTHFSPNDPLFFKNFDIFDEMFNFWPFALKALFLMHFTERPPNFVHFVTERPLFWHNLSQKDPYIWGAWWHSYVTFICECSPPPP